jgi:endonuclease/exonuclease/phosphatase family metal-dependent hydrolase
VSDPTLRVTAYNVHGFRAGVGAVAAVVADLAPDVLLLQESGPRRSLRGLARAAGFASAADPVSPLRRRVRNAVLVRPPWSIAQRRLVRFDRSRWWYPRGALVARVAHPDGPDLWAVSVHLGLDGPERGRHVRELVALVDTLEGRAPVVVGGDLNVTLDARVVATIATRLPDVTAGRGRATFPASNPTARIDHLFASAALRVAAQATGAVGASTASDHLPVTADLAWSPGGAGEAG